MQRIATKMVQELREATHKETERNVVYRRKEGREEGQKVRKMERIQRLATKMVQELRDLTHEERLKEM